MSKEHDGGPAFPCDWKDFSPSEPGMQVAREQYFGMTLRDYFAGQAMSAMIGLPAEEPHVSIPKQVSEAAYNMADAMIAERERKAND